MTGESEDNKRTRRMADHYQESSSFLNLPKHKIEKAKEIIDRVTAELEESDDGYCGCKAVVEDNGVWLFSGKESINLEHIEAIARALVEELEIDDPFYCSWSFTCSKPVIDQFGGGAFVLKRGFKTYWCDAMIHVWQQAESGGLIPLSDDNPS